VPEWMRNRFWGPSGNGLLNNLIAYWPGNEVAGNALDLHVNALHLTDVNTVTSNPGLVYPLARQHTAATNEYFWKVDDPFLSTGDVDFTAAQCLYMDSKPVASMASAQKWDGVMNEWLMGWQVASDRFRFRVVGNEITANSFGAPNLATWYLVIGWYDSVADTANVQVNNGVVDTLPAVAAPADTAARFAIGCVNPIAAPSQYWDGRIGPTIFWKSAAGAGGVKTPAERTALWNGGVPLQYTELTL